MIAQRMKSWLRQIFNPAPENRKAERRWFRPRLEFLEERQLLAVFWVSSTANGAGLSNLGDGTLRAAILMADSTPGPNTINFDIEPGGPQTIDLTSPLPTLTETVTIDGTSQPGWVSAPLITVDGSGLTGGNSFNGLTATANGCVIKGLVLQDFGNDGIGLYSNNNVVTGNWIENNGNAGVEIANAVSGNVIGGTTIRGRNVISGNLNDGVLITEDSTNNVVQGNYIGTNPTGTSAGPSSQNDGVNIEAGASNNMVGGTATGAGNLISANTVVGVLTGNLTSGSLIQGNKVGTNAAGNLALADGEGVQLGGTNDTVGGAATGAGNLISANTNVGVAISFSSSGDQVQGNKIGTDVTGGSALPNLIGVDIQGLNNTVGGAATGAGNLISGNMNQGIVVELFASGNLIQGNKIGTDATGSFALPNVDGVEIEWSNNTVGGAATGAGNLISGNATGILIDSGTSGIQVLGNMIGTNAAGTAPLANVGDGVDVSGTNNTVGGTAAGAGNLISGNDGQGVQIFGNGNQVQGNKIGTDFTGSVGVANGGDGVLIDRSNNTVGGTAAGAGNIIAFNSANGVELFSAGALDDAIRRNSIFQNAGGGISNAAGPNLPVPTLASATFNATTKVMTIHGTVTWTPSTAMTLEFFANPSGQSQGRVYIGSAVATTSGAGTVTFTATITIPTTIGFSSTTTPMITATATDPNGNTSAFSNAVVDPVLAAPAFTSARTTAFTVSTPGSFSVTTSGFPTPIFTLSGALPKGVTFNRTTGVLSGTPAPGSSGTYVLHLVARNGVGAAATQTLTITVAKQIVPLAVPAQVSVATPTKVTSLGNHRYEAVFTVTENTASTLAGRLTISGFTGLPTGVTFDSSTAAAFVGASKKLSLVVVFTNTTPLPLATLLASLTPTVEEIIA